MTDYSKQFRRIGTLMQGTALILGAALLVSAVRYAVVPAMSPGTDAVAVIAIDPGHGGSDGGATGINGTVEAELNLQYALSLKTILESKGYAVIMTRDDESTPGRNKKEDMEKRRSIIEKAEPDITVSVHMNKFTDPSVSGPMVFYLEGSEESRALAVCIIDSMTDAIGRPRRIANPGDYYMLRRVSMPSVIVECGFLSNSDDEALLNTAWHMEKLTHAIADGIDSYFADKTVRSPLVQ